MVPYNLFLCVSEIYANLPFLGLLYFYANFISAGYSTPQSMYKTGSALAEHSVPSIHHNLQKDHHHPYHLLWRDCTFS